MAVGTKTGGRKKGTPNKRTIARRQGVDELLDRYDYNPLEAMIAEASDQSVDPEVRRALHAAIMPYVYPKLKNVEQVSGLRQPAEEALTTLAVELERRLIESMSERQLVEALKASGEDSSRVLRHVPDDWLEAEAKDIFGAADKPG